MNYIQLLRNKPFPLNLYMFFKLCDFTPEMFQFRSAVAQIAFRESAYCWGRRIGKSLTTALTNLFMSTVCNWRGAYLCPQDGQLETPQEYWLNTPFGERVSNDWLYINGKKMIFLAPITNNNVRSKGLDFITFDEQAGCKQKQEVLLKVAEYMVQNSPHRHITRISTPVINTQFEKDYQRLEAKGQAFRYTYLDIQRHKTAPWVEAELEYIEDTRKDVDLGHYPKWLFDQEVLATFAAMGGTIFTDYVTGELPFIPGRELHPTEWIGVDINPRFGHTAVVCEVPEPGLVYVKEEIELGSDTELAAIRLADRARWNTTVSMENNGPGAEAYKVFSKIWKLHHAQGHLKGFDISDDVRGKRVMRLLRNQFLINPRASQTQKQIRGAQWDPKQKMEPLKGPEDHWIDAFYVANQPWLLGYTINQVRSVTAP